METRKAASTRLLILEFIVAVLVMAFLLAGPEGLDTLGRRVRHHLYLQRDPAPGAAAPVPVEPAAARAAESRASVAPTTSARPLPAAPAVTRPVPVEPRVRPAPAPTNKPSVDRTRTTRPTPRSRRPTPTPGAEATPPPLSPQQYLARLMREGHQLYQAGWYGPAAARFKEAARVNPGSATVQLWYGRSALRMGRAAEARAALERAIALAPSSDAAREARALLERMSGTE